MLIGGGDRDRDLLHRRLEPGIRECTALVVMPSFVPYITLDTKSTWFKLADEHCGLRRGYLHREGDLRDAVDLSAEVVNLRCLSQQCFGDSHLYREGEVYRLQRVVQTLDRQLPLQTAYVEMPYENELGGFDLFNSSTLGLKPTLRGWYGAPGIYVSTTGLAEKVMADLQTAQRDYDRALLDLTLARASKTATAAHDQAVQAAFLTLKTAKDAYGYVYSTMYEATTLFLVGKHFSVLGTNVIAGNVGLSADAVKVISRDVLQVTIPSTVSTVTQGGRRFVDVHLATPYGPTPACRIPVANDSLPSLTQAEQLLTKAKEEFNKAAAAAQSVTPVRFSWSETETPLAVAYDVNGNAAMTAPQRGGRENAGD